MDTLAFINEYDKILTMAQTEGSIRELENKIRRTAERLGLGPQNRRANQA